MINLHKNYRRWFTKSAMLIALAIPGLSTAELLNNRLDLPLMIYNSQKVTTYYLEGNNLFTVNSLPLAFKTSTSPTTGITSIPGGDKNFIINILVDETGTLIGGVSGHDLVLRGEVFVSNLGTVTGELLTGEIGRAHV